MRIKCFNCGKWARSDDCELRRHRNTNDKSLLIRGKWRVSIFMPRWASRILLEITEVRAERVQEITGEDAFAEGCRNQALSNFAPNFDIAIIPASQKFAELWDSLNAKRGYSWEKNPLVWVIGFKVVR